MGNIISGTNFYKAGLTALIWILAFQSPLERVWGPFSYIDELTALIGACLGLYDIVILRKGRPSKDQLWIIIPLLGFVAVGLAGNVIYQYQPLKCVIIDLYTNLKFFFAIGTGYYLFASMDWEELQKTAKCNSRLIVLLLFAFFLIDRIVHIWPTDMRYGIADVTLFYPHPTYLAATIAFMLVLLLVSYEKRNIPYIVMALLIMAFTLRSKALASAAVFIFLFILIVILKREIKLWHAIALGCVCFLIGLPLIWYYYFSVGLASVRAWLTAYSFVIMGDYFPIGTGFGTFASSAATKYFSPVYVIYNIEQYVGADLRWQSFLSDTFWPIIFGQTGVIGTCSFLMALFQIGKKILQQHKINQYNYTASLFALIYLLISSTSEAAFHNFLAVPLAFMIGIVFCARKSEMESIYV